jgi:hypothetical protein
VLDAFLVHKSLNPDGCGAKPSVKREWGAACPPADLGEGGGRARQSEFRVS